MTIADFTRTLYLGDRACKSITIDGWSSIVRVQVDSISRVRDPSGIWNYYTDEDIDDGILVFTGVTEVDLQTNGHVPNDSIASLDIVAEHPDSVTLRMGIDSVGPDARHHETTLRVRCTGLHLEDPARPGVAIP